MSLVLNSLSLWLHSLASIVFIGYFLLLALIFLPALLTTENGPALSAISKRSRPWLYTSLLVFIITGVYLMLINPNYLGLGNFSNFWAIVMLVKHILIVGMIAIGFWFNAILRVGPMQTSKNSAALALTRFRQYVNAMTISGVLVLLLTALAQVQ